MFWSRVAETGKHERHEFSVHVQKLSFDTRVTMRLPCGVDHDTAAARTKAGIKRWGEPMDSSFGPEYPLWLLLSMALPSNV